jgi:threonine/homoserine/homoserine lactone efflux protein
MTIAQLIAFLIPTLALNLTPGPDLFYVIGQSTKGGPRGALRASAGLWLGYLFHILLVTAGLAALLSEFPRAFTLLKFLGASYLLVLGAKMWLSRSGAQEGSLNGGLGHFSEGIFVSALNPKVAIFFLAFLPQFLEAGAPHPAWQLALLGLLFSFTSTVVNLSVGLASYRLSRRLSQRRGQGSLLNKACGAALIGMAAKLAIGR